MPYSHVLRRDGLVTSIKTSTDIEDMLESVKPLTDKCRRADAAWQTMVYAEVRRLAIHMLSCFPLFLRIFIDADVVHSHRKSAEMVIGAGALLLAAYALTGIVGFHTWTMGFFSWAGVAIAAFGLIAFALSSLHLAISSRYPAWSQPGGFGLLNVHCLVTGRRPRHLWIWLQDGAVIGYGVYLIISAPEGLRGLTAVLVMIALAACLGYTWYAHFMAPSRRSGMSRSGAPEGDEIQTGKDF